MMDRRAYIGGLTEGRVNTVPPDGSGGVGAVTSDDSGSPATAPASEQAPALNPLDAGGLERLERGLMGANLSDMIKGQVIRQVTVQDGRAALAPWGTEYFIDIKRLRETVAPTTNFFANNWLFRRLTGTLDRCLLAHADHVVAQTRTNVVSININVPTMIAGGVEGLAILGAEHGKAIVLEVRLDDVITDPAAFLVARALAKRFGCWVLLDAVNGGLLPRIDRERMGVDFVKLFWSKDLQATLASDRGDRMRAAISRIGPDRIVLGHVDDAQAVASGRSLGINLFQGFHIDSLGQPPTA